MTDPTARELITDLLALTGIGDRGLMPDVMERLAQTAERARAYLAQPEPQARLRHCPTHGQQPENAWGCPECVREMRRQLAQLGPVPVAERLPGPEDCDAEGRCWLLTVEDDYPQWRLHSIQGAQPGGYMIWVPVDSDGSMVDCFYTSHWLPHHALPVPQQEATDGP